MNGMTDPSVANMTGLSVAPRKKAHRGTRGRGKSKSSGTPGHDHHVAHVKAHAAGNHAEAKLHALNYAKAITSHLAEQNEPASAEPDSDADDAMGSMLPQRMASPPAGSKPTANKLAMAIAAMKKR